MESKKDSSSPNSTGDSSAMENLNQPSNFIKEIINRDLEDNTFGNRVHTRFPPEPNGYLHIGHAKSILLNYGLAKEYNGKFNLRFDDTNPSKEEQEYVDSIIEDVNWLGADYEDRLLFASDYFDQMYDLAVELIKKGLAYVDDQSAEEIRRSRGTLTEPGFESPYRNRTVEENLGLFLRMKEGNYNNGEKVLRAKIDMASPNLNLRDPIMYRILHATHHRTGDKWCIYPTYDWAHGIEDSIEGITHSICTLEFENHRPLYDWYLDKLEIYHPKQIEFARLNLNYTVMSKRKLLQLVEEKHVSGWDDPRMPTISGLRRRGYTPSSLKAFAEKIGVAKRDNVIDVALLEYSIREELNKTAPRAFAVLNPIKLVITNYPEDKVELLDAVNNPENPSYGTRKLPFEKVLYIEKDDFEEIPPPKFHRLYPGNEVRLKYAYIVKCESVVKDEYGNISEIHCIYDPETKSGTQSSNKKVKGTIHWVAASHSFEAEVRLYDRLFTSPSPDSDTEKTFLEYINPDSLKIVPNCKLELSLKENFEGENSESNNTFQFERLGYFTIDRKDSSSERIVFNRTVTLKDSWLKISQK